MLLSDNLRKTSYVKQGIDKRLLKRSQTVGLIDIAKEKRLLIWKRFLILTCFQVFSKVSSLDLRLNLPSLSPFYPGEKG